MGSFVPRGGVFDGAGIAYEPYAQDYWGPGRPAVPAFPPAGPAVPMAIQQRRLGFQGMGRYPGAMPIGPVVPPGHPLREKPGPAVAAVRRMELIGRGGTMFAPVFPCPITRAPIMTDKGERGGIFDGPYVPCDYDVTEQRMVPEAIRTLPLPSGATALVPVPEAGTTPRPILPASRPLYQKTFILGPGMQSLSPPAAPTSVRLLPMSGFGSGPDGMGCCG